MNGVSSRAAQSGRRLMSSAPSYSEKMDKTGRPISPHVFIYRFPTIAISSIMVRISGIMLTVGACVRRHPPRSLLGRHPRRCSRAFAGLAPRRRGAQLLVLTAL
jgi:hypothetical protein